MRGEYRFSRPRRYFHVTLQNRGAVLAAHATSAGRVPQRPYASASSPLSGVVR